VSSMEELERRLASVEERLGLEAGLRASQDRDLSSLKLELRSANNLLQALALTQSDQTRMLTALESAVAEHGERLERIEGGVQAIVSMLTTLLEKGEAEG
jgi:chromosome segregation ATPase